ncbi:isocitrate lyase/PEP mutase family protein [Actinoplanes sp. NEAU-A12]|uniref:Isocitrate lyase/PEP mutase family protein n=1 Tax=Actinoplanes sandaracinus TaxID=3045177 RepID=A0ABT6WBQ3_9ACTN|nr:isocitrate lyase/PEP mutase family protein [Actinoplanes sandaracinus]MDI6097167.1 isocitrate lyase/PEP mutase family protein [Actinoplanes sandaracinus]
MTATARPASTTPASALRALLASGRVTHAPGVYDPLTAALAVRAGHRAAHLSGAAVSAITLGRAEPGFVHGAQIADRASTLAPALDGVPLIADADTGHGNPLHAVWSAMAYVRAGIAGLHLEDQAGPKRHGHLAGPELIGATEAAAKITALADQVPEIVVIARTDAYAVRGLDETIVRCRAYAEAGAEAVLPAGVDTLAELTAVHRALPGVPLVVNRSEAGGSRPALTDDELSEVGVRLVLHPVAALLAAMRAASLAYRAIADSGTAEPVDRMPWAAFTTLAGQEEAFGPDARYVPGTLQT